MSRERRGVSYKALDRVERHLEERLAALKEIHREQRKSDQMALKLQAREYERRLDSLNNENTRLQKILDTSVPRETFENYRVSEQQAKELARKEQRASFYVNLGLVLTVVGLVIAYWRR